MSSSLINKATKGVFWSAIERFSVQGIQFVLSIIIARLLLPSDYGLIAMLSIFLAVAQSFIDSGFSNALIQKQNRTEIDYSIVFYFNIGIGLFFYLVFYISSPYIALFYSEPQLCLITKIVGLNVVINSFGVVQRAKFSIALNFRLQAVASLTAVILSGVLGVSLAYYGYGAWSLVMQSLLNNFFNVLLLWLLSKWYPLWCFSWNSFKSLFSFGSKLLVSGLLHTLYTNLYSLAIGKKMTSGDLGLYNRASTLAAFPAGNITDVMYKAMFPVLCTIQDSDEELEVYFLRYIRSACYVVFPLMIGLAVLADPFVKVVLTDRWSGIVPILQILSFAYMWDPVMRINNHFLYAKGRTDYTLKAEVFKKIIAFSILLLTIPFGLYVIAWGVVIYSFIDIFVITRYTCIISNVTLTSEIKKLFPVLLLALSMGACVWLSTYFVISSVLKLLSGVLIGVVYYLVVSKIFKFEEMCFLQNMIVRLKNK